MPCADPGLTCPQSDLGKESLKFDATMADATEAVQQEESALDTAPTRLEMAGLRPGSGYAVRVRPVVALAGVDPAQWEVVAHPSPPVCFTTQPSLPSQMKPPLQVSRDRRELKVKWNEPEEPGGVAMRLSYQLFMAPPPQDWPQPPDAQGYVEVYRGPERSARITRLLPGSRYSCWVLASNALGCGPPGQVALCSTKASVPDAPAPPVPLAATQVGAAPQPRSLPALSRAAQAPHPPPGCCCPQTSITLQWQAPAHHGSPITTFTLERDQGHLPALQPSAPGPGGAFGLAYAGPATQAVVAGLRPGHMYRFRLKADNDEGCSFWSELLVAGTAASAPGPPQGLSSSSVTQSQATVCWGPPLDSGGAPPHSYQVELQALSQPAAEMMGSEWLRIFEGPGTACAINSLRPGCAYRLRLRCANASGWGSWIQPLQLHTAPDVPDAPGAPAVLEAGATSLRLTWHPPLHNGGARITAYNLQQQTASPSPPSHLPLAPEPSPPDLANGSGPGHRAVGRGGKASSRLQADQQQQQQQGQDTEQGQGSGQGGGSRQPPPPSSPQGEGQAAPLSEAQGGGAGQPGPPHPLGGTQEGGGAAAALLVYCGPEPLALVCPLQPGSAHLFRVQAVNSQGQGQWSEWSAVSTAPDCPVAPAPPQLAAPPSSSTLAVQWEPPACQGAPITSYRLQLAMLGSGSASGQAPRAMAAAAPGSSPQQEGAGGLVEAAGSAAPGPPPAVSSTGGKGGALAAPIPQKRAPLKIPPAGAALLHPPAAKALQAGPPQPPPSALQPAGARGSSKAGQQQQQWQEVFQGPGSSAQLSGLQPATRYLLRLAAVNAVGPSPWSAPATLSTAPGPPSPPQHCSAAPLSSTQLRLTWQPPATDQGAPITGYAVDLAPGSAAPGHTSPGASLPPAAAAPPPASAAWQQVGGAGPGDLQLVLAGLLPGCTYQVRVRALNSCGSSPPTDAPSASTPAAPPGPPTRLTISHKAAGSARVRWEAPLDEHGAAVGEYLVEVREGGEGGGQGQGSAQQAAGPMAQGLRELNSNGLADLHAPTSSSCSDSSMGNDSTHPRPLPPLLPPPCPLPAGCGPGLPPLRSAAPDAVEQPTGPPGHPLLAHPPTASPSPSAASPTAHQPPAWPAAPWRAVYRGPDCSARLADLAPGTQYCLRVSAANAAGWGSPCSPESFHTALAPPGPPRRLTATLLPPTASSSAAQGVVMASSGAAAGAVPPAESSLLLCWQAPLQTGCTAPPASYEVQALALGLAGSGAERLGPSPATSLLHDVKLTASRACECLLSRLLLPGLRYGVRVRAVGAEGAGHGAWCEEEVVVELPGVAPPALLHKTAAGSVGADPSLLLGGAGHTAGAGAGAGKAKRGARKGAGGGKAGSRQAGVAGAPRAVVGSPLSLQPPTPGGPAGKGPARPPAAALAPPPAPPLSRKPDPLRLVAPVAAHKPPPPLMTLRGLAYRAARLRRKHVTPGRMALLLLLALLFSVLRMYSSSWAAADLQQ
ncbi:hypothetical protein QJQ45_024552 [Haematococcus lacustris]|nr:hypothetical protein QJQ45_024552 [Haematococcus lacustris]